MQSVNTLADENLWHFDLNQFRRLTGYECEAYWDDVFSKVDIRKPTGEQMHEHRFKYEACDRDKAIRRFQRTIALEAIAGAEGIIQGIYGPIYYQEGFYFKFGRLPDPEKGDKIKIISDRWMENIQPDELVCRVRYEFESAKQ
jgi:hypothetical protein